MERTLRFVCGGALEGLLAVSRTSAASAEALACGCVIQGAGMPALAAPAGVMVFGARAHGESVCLYSWSCATRSIPGRVLFARQRLARRALRAWSREPRVRALDALMATSGSNACLFVMKILCCCPLELCGRRPQAGQQPRARSASRQARAIRPAHKLALWAGTPVRVRVGITGLMLNTPHARAPSGMCVQFDRLTPPSRPSGDPVCSPPRRA